MIQRDESIRTANFLPVFCLQEGGNGMVRLSETGKVACVLTHTYEANVNVQSHDHLDDGHRWLVTGRLSALHTVHHLRILLLLTVSLSTSFE